MKNWGLLVFIGLCYQSCCYEIGPFYRMKKENPVFSISDNIHLVICKKEEIIITFLDEYPYNDSSYMDTYTLPNGKDTIGFVSQIIYANKIEERDFKRIWVGTGSEFWVEKCKFRVIKVEPRVTFDTLTKKADGQFLQLKLLNCPKQFCDCR